MRLSDIVDAVSMRTRKHISPANGGFHPTCSLCSSADVVIRRAPDPAYYIRTCRECGDEVNIAREKLTERDREVLVDKASVEFPVHETNGCWCVNIESRTFKCSSEHDARTLARLPILHRESLVGRPSPEEIDTLLKLYETYGITNFALRQLERWSRRQAQGSAADSSSKD